MFGLFESGRFTQVFLTCSGSHARECESEHKIMDFTQAERSQHEYTRQSLYGLDADLVYYLVFLYHSKTHVKRPLKNRQNKDLNNNW